MSHPSPVTFPSRLPSAPMLRPMSGSEAARRSAAGVGVPLLREVLPEISVALAGTLTGLGEPELAASLPFLGFHGRCGCKPGCRFVLTAPAGSSGSLMLWLEVGDDIVGEVSLDQDGMLITAFEISDCAALGIRLDWHDATAAEAESGR
jgi:hypothetical protein